MFYLPQEDGQGLLEYALILVMISVAVIAIMGFLGTQIGDMFGEVGNVFIDSRP